MGPVIDHLSPCDVQTTGDCTCPRVTRTEWAIFRKTDPIDSVSPMETGTFPSQAKAERIIALYYVNGPDRLEARSREVSAWNKP